jgi:hypothetical protein
LSFIQAQHENAVSLL